MNDINNLNPPPVIAQLTKEAAGFGFQMSSEAELGGLLRTLAASKPAGNLLELGTGVGISAAWILAGMDDNSRLLTVENNEKQVEVAKRYLGHDERISFYIGDGAKFLLESQEERYDFIFADAWPGKYNQLDEALSLLQPGGLYIIDDMLPQPNWPADHAPRVPKLIATLEARKDLILSKISWSTGIIIAIKK